MAKWVARRVDGMILRGGPFEPSDVTDEEVVFELPDDVEVNRALQRWDKASRLRDATDEEIADWEARQPRHVDPRVIFEKMTAEEIRSLDRFGLLSDHPDAPAVYKLMTLFKAGSAVDVNSPEVKAGLEAIRTAAMERNAKDADVEVKPLDATIFERISTVLAPKAEQAATIKDATNVEG